VTIEKHDIKYYEAKTVERRKMLEANEKEQEKQKKERS